MSKLLDQFGNPIEREVLSEPQTARLTQLYRHFSDHPGRGITPARLNTILMEAEQGHLLAQHELFTDMEERDGHVFAELSKRKRTVAKLPWRIVPPRNATAQETDLAAYVEEMLQDLPDFEDLVFDCLDGISHGFSALELEWTRIGQDWTIQQAHHRPQSWFQVDPDTRTKIRLRNNTYEGLDLTPFGWVLHTHKAMSGYIARSGLGRVLVWPYVFKHYSVGDLAEFLDVYGLPMRLGRFPSNATDQEKTTLWQAVSGIGHHAAAIIPQSMAIEFSQAATGDEKPFEAMISWCERTQSKAITGSTLTSDAGATGLGSGLAEIHNEVRLDIRDSDCKQLAGTLTRDLIYPILAINKGWADIRRTPRFVFDTLEAEDLKLYADSLPKLVAVGMKIPAQWAHEKLRIPIPEDKDEVLQTPIKTASLADLAGSQDKKTAQNANLKAVLSSTSAGVSEEFPDQVALDGAVRDLEKDFQDQVVTWLTPALTTLRQVDNEQDALALLAEQNPLVDSRVLTESIARAVFVSELWGMDSVSQELARG
jgi:phage gp29-like protein